MNADQLREFKARYGGTSDQILAGSFGITIRRVRALAGIHRLGKDRVHFPHKTPRWTAQELISLARLYPNHDNVAIGRRLGRTVKSVAAKAHRLGLVKSDARLGIAGRSNVAMRRDR